MDYYFDSNDNDKILRYTQDEFKRLLLDSSTVYKVNPVAISRGICAYCATMNVLRITNIDLAKELLINMYSKDALFANNCSAVWIKQINQVFKYLTLSKKDAFVSKSINDLSDNKWGVFIVPKHAIAYYKDNKFIWLCDNSYRYEIINGKRLEVPIIQKLLNLDLAYFNASKIVHLQNNDTKWYKIPLSKLKNIHMNMGFAELTRTKFNFDMDKVSHLKKFYTDPNLLIDNDKLKLLERKPNNKNRQLWVRTLFNVLEKFKFFSLTSLISCDCSHVLKRLHFLRNVNIRYLKNLYNKDYIDKVYRIAVELGYTESKNRFLNDNRSKATKL